MSINSREFKKLRDEWLQKLKDLGFDDVEDRRGNLKYKDIRTIAWDNRDEIQNFFLRLDHLMTYYPEMPKDERAVLELWTQGIYEKKIAEQIHMSLRKVQYIVGRYKYLIRAINKLYQASDRSDLK